MGEVLARTFKRGDKVPAEDPIIERESPGTEFWFGADVGIYQDGCKCIIRPLVAMTGDEAIIRGDRFPALPLWLEMAELNASPAPH